ncbi:MAG: hypothetical protein QOG53_1160 [Frankiales bacterium]|nr:hypothetical protein [Frankiales bacterium]
MLGRKDYTADEIAHAKRAVKQALKAFGDAGSPAGLETVFFNDALLALDRRFVHRVRLVSGKDGTPVNEVELLAASLMDHDAKLQLNNVIKYAPESSVLGLQAGDRIALTAEQFKRLAAAFFADLESKFG